MKNAQKFEQVPVYSATEVAQLYISSEDLTQIKSEEDSNLFTVTPIENIAPYLKLSALPFKSSFSCYVFLNSGNLSAQVNSTEYRLNCGEFMLVPAGEILRLNEIKKDTCGFIGTFSDSIFDRQTTATLYTQLLNNSAVPHVRLSEEIRIHFNQIFTRITAIYNGYSVLKLDMIRDYFSVIFNELTVAKAEEKLPKPSAGQKLALSFKALLSTHIYSDLTATDYAKRLSVSTNHLNKVMKRETGLTTTELILKRKLVEAQILLKHSSLSVSGIAYSLGFESPAYFSKFFKKHMEITAVSYRNSVQ